MWATQCRICGSDVNIDKYDDPLCVDCDEIQTTNDLGNTPAAQAQMDALAESHDESGADGDN